MKHGLKQEIKRGLSVLMAVSMVAGSALPVMAEEVVEEAVEVEVVSEDVAEEADIVTEESTEAEDIVVDVAEAEDVEEVVEEVVVDGGEEATAEEAGEVMVDAPTTHDFEATEYSTYTLAIDRYYYEEQWNDVYVVYYTCGVPGCNDATHTVKHSVPAKLPTEVGKENKVVTTIDNMKLAVVLEKKTKMDCKTNTPGYEEYVLYSVDNNFEIQTKIAADQIDIPVTHTPGNDFTVQQYGTCTTPAVVTYNCSVCGAEMRNQTLEAPGHVYKVEYSASQSKLWNTNGTAMTAHVKCVSCNIDPSDSFAKCFKSCGFSKDITFSGDVIREKGYKAPTCVAQGEVVKYVLDFMQKEALKDLIDYDSFRDQVTGLKNQEKLYYLPALGHLNARLVEEPVAKMEANEVTGIDWGKVKWECDRCQGGTLTYDLSEPTPEKLSAGYYTIVKKTIQEATCLVKGIQEWSIVGKLPGGQLINGTKVCKVTILAGEHKYSAADAAKATCAEPYTKDWVCTECGTTVKGEPIYVAHKIVKKSTFISKPTCAKEGIADGYCTVCLKDYNEIHNAMNAQFNSATDYGKNQLLKLYNQYKKDFAVAKLSHKYEIYQEYWDGGNYATLRAYCVNGCSKLYEQIVPVDIVYDKYPTYDQTGIRHYTATMDFNEVLDGQHIVIPHTSNKVTVKATGVADKVTLSIADKTVEYTGNRQRVDVSAKVLDGGKNVIADVAKEVVVKYYKDAAYTQQFSGEPYTAGTYYVKATLEATKSHEGATAEAVLVINKKNPTVTVKQSLTTVKNTKKNKVNLTVSIKDVIGQKGKVTYVADNGITVSKKGIVTIKKGTKKGTYKVKVNVAATPNYNGVTKTIKIKVTK